MHVLTYINMKFLLLCMALTVISSEEVKEFQNSNLQFAADVYKKISTKNNGNFLVCPLSAEIVLSLAAVGARANSAKQLTNCLHLPDDVSKIENIFQKINNNFEVETPYQFSSANKIYLNKKWSIKNDYKNIAMNTFKAGIENVNFDDQKSAAKQINEWVESRTSNKIQNLVPEESLNPDIVAILVNAMYFHGNWDKEFMNMGDRKTNFYVNENETVLTNFMDQRDDFNYHDNEQLKAEFLELPFVGGDVTMTIVLPKKKNTIANLENHILEVISPQPLKELDSVISIPKFQMETTIQLKEVLKELGVTEPFSSSANFQGMSDDDIYIDDVVQKTFIEINEKGATAAASTKMSFMPVSMPRVIFNANRPFIYFLRHRITGIFFIGRFLKP